MFVGPKRRYSRLIREHPTGQAFVWLYRYAQCPYAASASQYRGKMHYKAIPVESERLSKQGRKQANACSSLVLRVDDFATRKGHIYNTGIHDLKGETMLNLLPGRKLEDLRTQQHPNFQGLKPKAVVMDLARAYHAWISECFPTTIRIADRFHVHGYIIEAMQGYEKRYKTSFLHGSEPCSKSITAC